MVNTVPPFHGAAATVVGPVVSGLHTASVLPDVFAQPARARLSAPRDAAPRTFVMSH
jgi:hypothetical protein